MNYFNYSLNFAKKNPLRTALIIILDITFYLLFIPITWLWMNLLTKHLTSLPMQAMGAMMESIESLQQVQLTLLKVFFGIISSIFLFFLIIILNFAIIKGIIWLLTLKKKIDFWILLRGLLLDIVMITIFLIPLIIGFSPLLKSANEYMYTQVIDISFADFVPLIIVIFLMIYFFTLTNYFLAKERSFKKAFRDCFKIGVTKLGKLILPFIGFFVISAAVIKLLINIGIFHTWPGLIIALMVIVIISFLNRLYICKAI